MKLYVVTSGQYSDYHIVAIFTDKKAANKYNKEMLLSENTVLTMNSDVVPKTPVGLYPYFVEMKYDGTVVSVLRKSSEYFNDPWAYVTDYGRRDAINQMQSYVWAKNKKHAIKITNEKRTIMIAKNEWLSDEIAIEKASANGHLSDETEQESSSTTED